MAEELKKNNISVRENDRLFFANLSWQHKVFLHEGSAWQIIIMEAATTVFSWILFRLPLWCCRSSSISSKKALGFSPQSKCDKHLWDLKKESELPGNGTSIWIIGIRDSCSPMTVSKYGVKFFPILLGFPLLYCCHSHPPWLSYIHSFCSNVTGMNNLFKDRWLARILLNSCKIGSLYWAKGSL